ncbi:glycosyltransferase [Klebsiella michiganensis]|uniref:glycosyltransferase n=1 Tax=Klebsiella michiganensis TaxID=1134687 RepID=UPI0032DBC24D
MKFQETQNEIVKTIIVINKKYMQKDKNEGFPVGATSFSLHMKNFIKRNKGYIGCLYYEREDDISTPFLYEESYDSDFSLCMKFNYSMPTDMLTETLRKAFHIFTERLDDPSDKFLVYYQTDTLLSFHPVEIPYCVTHHGPFIEDFAHHYSYKEAGYAFGGKDKVNHLLTQQNKGVSVLKNGNGFAILHSSIQNNYLSNKGISQEKCLKITPPVNLPIHTSSDKINSPIIHKFMKSITENDVILLTAVARLDYFKNVEMFLQASVKLAETNQRIKILIIGDNQDYDKRRENMHNMIPLALKDRCIIHPKLSPTELSSVFTTLKKKGIFVCTSRYETLGITPLEAALSGIYTLMPALDSVEASLYFKDEDRFYYDTTELVIKLKSIVKLEVYNNTTQQKYIENIFSTSNFSHSVYNAWNAISISLNQ